MNTVIQGTLTSYQSINPQANKTCLILHGWGQSGQLWQNTAKLLNPVYHYILLDLPGFGNSSHLPQTAGIKQYATFIKHFIKKLNLKKVTIIGHSFGGQIATQLALTHPQLINQLILISAAIIRLKTPKQKLKSFIYRQFSFLKLILPKTIIKFILKQLSSSDYTNASPQHKEILKLIVHQDLSSQLKKIKTATHIIWGQKDKEIPYMGKFIANQLPNARLSVIYNADHNPHLFQPQELTQTINLSLP